MTRAIAGERTAERFTWHILSAALDWIPPGSIKAYLVALAIVAAATALRLALPDWIAADHFVTLVPAIMLSSILCGPGAGTFSVLLSALAADYFLFLPLFSLDVWSARDRVALATFVVIGEAIVLVAGAMRSAVGRLQEANAALRVTFESSPDAVLVADAAGTIVATNKLTEQFFGFAREELIGRPVEMLLPVRARQRHVALRPAFRADNKPREMGAGIAVLGRRRDGEEFPVTIRLGPIRRRGKPMVIATIRDLSVEKAMLAALADNALPDALFIHNHAGRFIQVNQGACESTGYSREELLSMAVPDVDQDFDLQRAQAEWNRFKPGERATLYGHHRRKDGSTFPVEVNFGVLGDTNQRLYIAIVRDITKRMKLDERIRHLQKVELLGQLTSGVAHDFNNVMAAIVTSLELAQLQVGLSPAVQQLIDSGLSAALSGARLSHRLLAFARKQPVKIERLNVNEVISGMVDLLGSTLGSAVKIELRLAADIWPVATDRAQIEGALMNLAVNALDAMPEGGKLTIMTANRQVKDPASVDRHALPADYVVTTVTDTGIGMTPEVLRRAFEPFFTTKTEGRGTGLGLSIIEGFAKESGGFVSIESQPGQGTTVSISLPRTDSGGSSIARDATESGLPRGKETILVVEDVAELRSAAVGLIGSLGYRTLVAPDASAALVLLDDHPEIDLVFTDIAMPGGLRGDDLARRIQASSPRVKILLTSGHPPQQGSEPTALTEFPLITKPYRVKDLALALRGILEPERIS